MAYGSKRALRMEKQQGTRTWVGGRVNTLSKYESKLSPTARLLTVLRRSWRMSHSPLLHSWGECWLKRWSQGQKAVSNSDLLLFSGTHGTLERDTCPSQLRRGHQQKAEVPSPLLRWAAVRGLANSECGTWVPCGPGLLVQASVYTPRKTRGDTGLRCAGCWASPPANLLAPPTCFAFPNQTGPAPQVYHHLQLPTTQKSSLIKKQPICQLLRARGRTSNPAHEGGK